MLRCSISSPRGWARVSWGCFPSMTQRPAPPAIAPIYTMGGILHNGRAGFASPRFKGRSGMSETEPPPSPPTEFPRYYIIQVIHEGEEHFVACEAIVSAKVSALPAGVRGAIYDAFVEETHRSYPEPAPPPPPP